ncbi:MAG: hypothetical protein AABY15_06155 [Nanoarchaeota archaeon]
MAFFGIGRKDKVIDWSQGYGKKSETKKSEKPTDREEASDAFGVLGNLASGSSSNSSGSSDNGEFSGTVEENRKKLSKRLLDITNKLDEISTQIYHLQQRVELLERKAGVKGGI